MRDHCASARGGRGDAQHGIPAQFPQSHDLDARTDQRPRALAGNDTRKAQRSAVLVPLDESGQRPRDLIGAFFSLAAWCNLVLGSVRRTDGRERTRCTIPRDEDAINELCLQRWVLCLMGRLPVFLALGFVARRRDGMGRDRTMMMTMGMRGLQVRPGGEKSFNTHAKLSQKSCFGLSMNYIRAS
jgi:hypothetical protein